MGQESASYFLKIAPELEDAVVVALREGGAEAGSSDYTWIDLRVRDEHRYWIDLRVRDEHRYWIDLRVHRGPEPLLEIRIALCNDEWSIRAPLQAAFTALPPAAAAARLRGEEGDDLGPLSEPGWSLRLEQDYVRRRAEFVRRVGDFTAPISADYVYLYVHQTRRKRDDDTELEWQRQREITRMEEMWDPPAAEPELPPGHPEAPGEGG